MEIWKDIKGYEGLYKVSNFGRVKSLKYHKGQTEKVLSHCITKLGYVKVQLCRNGKAKSYLVHRLVADAFICNPNNHKEINHKDENKENNTAVNLEWCDHLYNVNYGTRNGKIGGKPRAVLQYDKQGNFIKKWSSLVDAGRAVGAKTTNTICACCRGRKPSAHGYVWKYAEVA